VFTFLFIYFNPPIRYPPLYYSTFVLVGESFWMYRSWEFSVSCFRARFSVRVASLRRCFDGVDLLVCQARRRPLFSRTSRSICRFVLSNLLFGFMIALYNCLPLGVTRRDPQCVCLPVRVPCSYKAISKQVVEVHELSFRNCKANLFMSRIFQIGSFFNIFTKINIY